MKITIIGAGPGGYETAVAAAKKGIEVTIVSDGFVGGTCLNEGCIPTKTFCKNAELMEDLKKAETFGLNNLSFDFDFSKVIERKNSVVDQLKKGVEFLLQGKNITLVNGKAELKDKNTVIVGGQEYKSDYIIIATGSTSAILPIPGNDLEGVITSKEILEIDKVPERLCVIGAGVIGLEFASIFKSFGSEVTVVEYCKDILPRFDTDLAKRLKQALSKRGIKIETSAQVQCIEKVEGGLKVNYIKKDKDLSVEADKVLMAVGRRPNISSLNLDDLDIKYSKKGIEVNHEMRTNIPSIFAIGDVVGGLMLAHVATFQGIKALSAIMKENNMENAIEDRINLNIVPAAVFTNPEAATIGRTEDECKENGIPVKCYKSFFRANGKALSMDEPEGFCKIVVAEGSEGLEKGQILGCHLFGAHSADIIQEVAVLMNNKLSISDFRAVIHAHPTLTEVLQSAISE